MLHSNKKQSSPAHENAKLSTIAIPYWIIYYPSASQYQITWYYQKQSSTDELEEQCAANNPLEFHEWIEKPCLFRSAAAAGRWLLLCRQKKLAHINSSRCKSKSRYIDLTFWVHLTSSPEFGRESLINLSMIYQLILVCWCKLEDLYIITLIHWFAYIVTLIL